MMRFVRFAAAAGSVLVAAAFTGCQTTSAVGPAPGPSVEAVSPMASPSPVALKIDVTVDAHSVSPLNKSFDVRSGQDVVLLVHTDHNASLIIKGPDISRTVTIGQQMTEPVTFVPGTPGVITISSSDPAADIARLTVS